jgi:catalase
MWKDLMAVAVLSIAITHPVQLAAEEASASQKSLAEQLVDAFNAVFGVHPGLRANHPKGVVLEGTFTPSSSAPSLTKAAHLQKRKTSIPVTVRFSAGSELCRRSRYERYAARHGCENCAAGRNETDLVVLSFNGFPVANAEEFRDFLLAVAASAPDAPKPTDLENSWGPPGRESLRKRHRSRHR